MRRATYLNKPDRTGYIRDMFGRISGQYDLVNRLISLGQDRCWRRRLVNRAMLPKAGRLLDVGTGTGDIALEALSLDSTLRVTAVDFSFQMLTVGRSRKDGRRVLWCKADALQLPFPDAVFDAVASGYLIRNVHDARRAFEEQIRVVKPGGLVVCLDTVPVPNKITRLPVIFHLKIVIPLLGWLIVRDREAYSYLYKSTQAFMTPERLASTMKTAGLFNVSHQRFMFGTMVILRGLRP